MYVTKTDKTEKDSNTDTVHSDENSVVKEDALSCFHNISNWLKNTYNLSRSTASEILVFMVHDLDRRYRTEILNAHPLSYAMKGPNLSNDRFSAAIWHTIEVCESTSLNVLATSIDGKWHRIGVRGLDYEPLIIYQLQRDIWKSHSKYKQELLAELKSLAAVKSIDDVQV
ncbi:hypothetical protein DPMN_074466 [Dreissena polymorpha]|uniref:Uncharacterized protein n=1 Tax=Dreissena polymorpha TaxID=45954 RepID=A0A9D4BE29_DREPO|nr:hypothetical protein DPMN_074466 [Dreissena polymorpha]